jgi:CheY-like chemotaxis protein
MIHGPKDYRVTPSSTPEASLNGLRLLLVEDATETRDALSCVLKAEGVEVTAVPLGTQAIDAVYAAETPFDVLLTDLGLPDIPGDLVIRQIIEIAPKPPAVVAMTGYGEPFHQRAREAGAVVVIAKPFEWSALRTILLGLSQRAAAA